MTSFDATFELKTEADEAALEEARSFVGVPLRIEQWSTEASIDNIRHYALGLGDLNPLWQDYSYGRQSVHRTVVAPPTFLNAIFDAGVAPGLGGLPALHTGSRWVFHSWVRLGDQLRARAELEGAELVESRRGRRIVQYGRTEYFRLDSLGREEKVAEHTGEVVRIAARGSAGGLEFAPRQEHHYSEVELAEIERAALAVEIRGPVPRYWEDVAVDDSLGQVVKGPFTRLSMVCYYMGAPGSPGYRAFDAWWRNRHRAHHQPDALPNTFDPAYFAGTGVTSLGHHVPAVARTLGMPGVYDNGNQRTGLMATLITNWMGDDALLVQYGHQLRAPVILGDTLYFSGEVTAKTPAASHSPVTLHLQAHNQLGQLVSTGDATVLLPRKEGDAAATLR
jgi:acyl dehydratase